VRVHSVVERDGTGRGKMGCAVATAQLSLGGQLGDMDEQGEG
jgi:hypothetical protein